MTQEETIVRIAARGDGVTASGRHVAGAVPGDVLKPDNSIAFGPHHVAPPCRHFVKCGGCQLQHADEDVLRQFVTDRVVNAAAGQAIEPVEVLAAHLSPSQSRRRATLHGLRTGGRGGKSALVGFREAGSHRTVDIRECPVLRPELYSLVEPVRAFLAKYGERAPVDVGLAMTDQGVDLALGEIELEGLAATEAALALAQDQSLARLSIDQGFGAETIWEPEPVTVSLSGVPVGYPAGAFLQATQDGEDALVADVRDWCANDKVVADLFAGLGTFSFALASGSKVLAVEAARDAHLARKAAANARGLPVHALHRDLFRNPLTAEELSRFDAAVLDPPRAGAKEQVMQIAASSLPRLAYVSCNPASWARDAARLVAAGFRLQKVRPVGQFRWSTHVELTSLFTR